MFEMVLGRVWRETRPLQNVDNLFKNVVYAGDLNRNIINDQIDFLDTLTPKHKAA